MSVVAGTVVIGGPRAIVRIFVSSCQTPNSTARTPRFDASACTIPRSRSGSRLGAGDPSAAVEAEATKDKKAMRGRPFAIMKVPLDLLRASPAFGAAATVPIRTQEL